MSSRSNAAWVASRVLTTRRSVFLYTGGEPLVRKREMIARTGAHSTNLEGMETAEELCARCDRYARDWAPTAERLWSENPRDVSFVR